MADYSNAMLEYEREETKEHPRTQCERHLDSIKISLGKNGFVNFLHGQVIEFLIKMNSNENSLPYAKQAQIYMNRIVLELQSK